MIGYFIMIGEFSSIVNVNVYCSIYTFQMIDSVGILNDP